MIEVIRWGTVGATYGLITAIVVACVRLIASLVSPRADGGGIVGMVAAHGIAIAIVASGVCSSVGGTEGVIAAAAAVVTCVALGIAFVRMA